MSITFKIHYVAQPDQVLLIVLQDKTEIPLHWIEGDFWVGTYEYEAPKHYIWSYIVRSLSGNTIREEEVIGTREHEFVSNASVRDWWYYPWLTEIEEEPKEIVFEEKIEKVEKVEEVIEEKKEEIIEVKEEPKVEMTIEEQIIIEKKKEKELKVRLCGSENNWDLFRVWTGKAHCRVLYDSAEDGFDAKSFNEAVKGVPSVIIFVHAQGYIFGHYTSVEVPEVTGNEPVFVKNDRKSFAFSFKNPYDHGAIRYLPEDYSETLQLFGNDDTENLCAVKNFFTIKTEKDKCFISENFEKGFDETSGRGALMFVRAVEPDTFPVDEIIAVHLAFNLK